MSGSGAQRRFDGAQRPRAARARVVSNVRPATHRECGAGRATHRERDPDRVARRRRTANSTTAAEAASSHCTSSMATRTSPFAASSCSSEPNAVPSSLRPRRHRRFDTQQCSVERSALRGRKRREHLGRHRREQIGKPRERERHLGFGRPSHEHGLPAIMRKPDALLPDGGLSDPRLAGDQEPGRLRPGRSEKRPNGSDLDLTPHHRRHTDRLRLRQARKRPGSDPAPQGRRSLRRLAHVMTVVP